MSQNKQNMMAKHYGLNIVKHAAEAAFDSQTIRERIIYGKMQYVFQTVS